MKQRIYHYSFGILQLVACSLLLYSCNNEGKTAQTETIIWDTSAAFIIDSAVEMDDIYIPDFRQQDSAFALSAFIIQPGEYRSHEVTVDMKNAEWFTLTRSKGANSIEQKKVELKKVHGEYEDAAWIVSSDNETEIHLANISNIKTGGLEAIILDTSVIVAGENVYFDYRGTHYRLYASGYRTGDRTVTNNYRLILEAQKGGVSTKQILFAHSYYGTYRSCIIEFAGDIDGDNKLDMIIRDTEPDGSTIMLYLSDNASKDQLLKLSGFHQSFIEIGC